MFDLQNIKLAWERSKKAVELKPSLSQSTHVAKAQLGEDMRFDIDVDGVKVSAAVPKAYGGNGTGPGSTAHALSSLICCVMVGYLIKFAERGITVSELTIEVQGDCDSNIKFGFTDLRYIINVKSDAPEDEIQRAVEDSDATSFGLAVLQQPIDAHRELRVTAAVN